MRELSLFTGAGGGILGTHLLGWTPIGYVEWDDYCQRVLAARIADGLIARAPIFGDVRQFVESGAAREYRGFADVVSGGFPCQAFSTATHGKPTAANMWPWMRRVVEECEPRFVFAENVQRKPIQSAADDLAAMGYTVKCMPLSAADLGADHVRTRYWLRAYADVRSELPRAEHAEASGLQGISSCVWETFADSSRMADGVADRLDRLRATGNGQVPRVVAAAWRSLS